MADASTDVKKTWLELFSALWQAVLSDSKLRKKPPALKIAFSDRLNPQRGARIRGGDPFVVEISTGFALGLRAELRTVQDGLAALAFRSPLAQRARRDEVLSVVEEFTIRFILLHEMFHLIGGHADWVAKRPNALMFDEQRLGLPLASGKQNIRDAGSSYDVIADAYILESEADCSAIQWIIQAMSQTTLQRLLRTQTERMQSFHPRQRLAAFRLLLASVWLVIRRLESAREELVHNDSETHPLPVTRVFAAFSTFIQQYSRISKLRFDAQGGGQHTLTGSDVISIREFLEHVLNPVLTSDWNPGSSHLPPESLEAQMRFYLRDFGNYLLNRPVETIAGRELLRMEQARFRMDQTLRSFRYYRAVKLERIKPRKPRRKTRAS